MALPPVLLSSSSVSGLRAVCHTSTATLTENLQSAESRYGSEEEMEGLSMKRQLSPQTPVGKAGG